MTRAVDLFAGWGGFTEGAERAGVDVVWAANHWPLAVDAHAANHPRTQHVCQDLRQADWRSLPSYDLLLAAPACQGHSQAAQPARKSGAVVRAQHDSLRGTAWCVVECAEQTLPGTLIVENVPDFRRWQLYRFWKASLVALGYSISEHMLTASEHGTPQRRERLFVVGTRNRTHRLELPCEAELAFGPSIEWDAPARWKRIDDSTPSVKARIAKARGLGHGRRFLTQHVTGHPGVGLDEPIRTITTKDQWAVVDGERYRPLTVRENARAMGFADDYGWPEGATRKDCIRGLGNAVCPPLAQKLVTAALAA